MPLSHENRSNVLANAKLSNRTLTLQSPGGDKMAQTF